MPLSDSVAVAEFPPTTELGDIVRLAKEAGSTVTAALTFAVRRVAVTVSVSETATPAVATPKVLVELPAGTVTDACTPKVVLLAPSEIVAPPAGADLAKVTVPVATFPPTIEAGAMPTETRSGDCTLRSADWLVPLNPAVRVTAAEVATGVVEMLNVALVAPTATVTDAGTVAAMLPDVRETTTPPAGAGPERVTVPVEADPPSTVEGDTLNPTRLTAVRVRVAVWLSPR